jgi:hypothetical protein
VITEDMKHLQEEEEEEEEERVRLRLIKDLET